MMELLGDAIAKASTALVILPVILIIVMGGVVILLIKITSARPDIVEKEKWKYERFDAANPSKYPEARQRVSMQYLGYLIMFLAVEPAAIILAFLATTPRSMLGRFIEIYAIFVAVYTPLLFYAIREARRVESWILD